MLARNRKLFNAWLAGRADIECMPAQNGLTAFPRWAGGDTEQLDTRLREKYDAAIVPGRWFEMPDHFRVGFGYSKGQFEQGLERLGSALDDLR
jgi:aspartate/methionine/tyrosine aminotransferase